MPISADNIGRPIISDIPKKNTYGAFQKKQKEEKKETTPAVAAESPSDKEDKEDKEDKGVSVLQTHPHLVSCNRIPGVNT